MSFTPEQHQELRDLRKECEREKSKSEANKRQVGGDHYSKLGDFQPWDAAALWELDFFQGSIVAYVVRWKDKGGIEDLEKAQHFLEKYIEVLRTRKGFPVQDMLLKKNTEPIGPENCPLCGGGHCRQFAEGKE